MISWGINRSEAILRMKRALEEFVIEGVKTIIPLHQRIIEHDAFIKGKFYTDFVEKEIIGKV